MVGRPPDEPVDASVVIITHARAAEAARAIRSALTQRGRIETIVIIDGPDPRAADYLHQEFGARIALFQGHTHTGYILRRNQAASLARGAIIVSIDDDAEFTSPDTVADATELLSSDLVGAVGLPYVNVRTETRVRQQGDHHAMQVAETFVGTAYAVRRDVFMAVGGYRAEYVHQGEELDFCIRMLDHGRCVTLATTAPIRHYQSPNRDHSRWLYFGRQNQVLFAMWNVPHPFAVPHLAATTVVGLIVAKRAGDLNTGVRGLARGFKTGVRYRGHRTPVSWRTYRLSRSLRRYGPRPLEEVKPVLISRQADRGMRK